MITAKCTRCGATSTGDSFEDARAKMDHAIGLSRGIKCGDNYNCVVEVKDETKKETSVEKPKVETVDKSKTETPKPVDKTKKSKYTKE